MKTKEVAPKGNLTKVGAVVGGLACVVLVGIGIVDPQPAVVEGQQETPILNSNDVDTSLSMEQARVNVDQITGWVLDPKHLPWEVGTVVIGGVALAWLRIPRKKPEKTQEKKTTSLAPGEVNISNGMFEVQVINPSSHWEAMRAVDGATILSDEPGARQDIKGVITGWTTDPDNPKRAVRVETYRIGRNSAPSRWEEGQPWDSDTRKKMAQYDQGRFIKRVGEELKKRS